MSSFTFRQPLQDRVTEIIKDAVANRVVTFDSILKEGDYPEEQFPLVVVNVKTADQTAPGEYGTRREIWNWQVAIYFLDVEKDNYSAGELRRDQICHDIMQALEIEPRLKELSVQTSDDGLRQYVFNSDFTNVVFDSSGQEGYYTFVAELYLTVEQASN